MKAYWGSGGIARRFLNLGTRRNLVVSLTPRPLYPGERAAGTPLACSDSELTSETMNSFIHFGRTPWTGDRPISRPLPTQDTTQRDADIHPC